MRTTDKRRIDAEPDEADAAERDYDSDTETDDEGEDEDRSEDETAPIGVDDIETGEEYAALDDKETSDGLNDLEESVRRAAEETVTEDDADLIDSLPVFERGMLPPKV